MRRRFSATLIQAARELFKSHTLRRIKRAAAATDGAVMGGGGQGHVEGELRLFVPMACLNYGAGLNAGVYQLMPFNGAPAVYSSNGLQNVSLIARGNGGEALITIPYAYFFRTNVCGYEGMQGSLMIQQVNGVQCGRQLFFSDQVASNGMCQ